MPEVSIVIPVYQNEDALQELHRRLVRVMGKRNIYEIIFVDDASLDGSALVLENLARENPHVRVVSLEKNAGQHRAVLTGMDEARGDSVIVMDADLQDPPEAIPKLLIKLQGGFSAVFAGRRGRYESWSRLLTSKIFKWLLHLFSGVPSDAGLFVAIDRAMVEKLIAMKVPHPFVVAMIGKTGLRVTSIPVTRAPRSRGRSAYSFWARLRSGLRAFHFLASRRGS